MFQTKHGFAVIAPICDSDRPSLTPVISMAQAVSNLFVSRKVFLKHQVNWNTVCGATQDLPLGNISPTDNPVEVFNEHLLLLVGRALSTMAISVRNKDKPWFDDQYRHAMASSKRPIFVGPVIALMLTGKRFSAVKC